MESLEIRAVACRVLVGEVTMNQTPIDCAGALTEMYAAFQRGDIPAILEMLDDNVEWESWADNYAQRTHVPWLAPRKGKQGAADFFAIVGAMKFHTFRVIAVLGGPGQAAGEVEIDAELSGGKRLRDQELHLVNFNEAGKVVRFRHYLDTAKHIVAAK
ncbi:MAG: nuclear transport factor 2 family protein [Bryobacteraceae bacterium]